MFGTADSRCAVANVLNVRFEAKSETERIFVLRCELQCFFSTEGTEGQFDKLPHWILDPYWMMG